jgi:hypothetical protein
MGRMKLIESFSFGAIVIDGERFKDDVIILRDTVRSPWWRRAGGHVFAVEDLAPVLDEAPECVVLGTGAFGMVRVPAETRQALEARGARVVVEKTPRAVAEYNHLRRLGRDVAACLHLTC